MSDQVQENRLKNFASFFKGYMSVMPLATAALAPILTLAKAIPVFESQRTSLATFSGLFGFLLVAWVFFARGVFVPLLTDSLTKRTSPMQADDASFWTRGTAGIYALMRIALGTLITMMPLLLIAGSAYCFFSYSHLLDATIASIQDAYPGRVKISRHDALQTWGTNQPIPGLSILQGDYLGIFLFAELAFVLMALKEYAYGVLKISEVDVLGGPVRSLEKPKFSADIGDPYASPSQSAEEPVPTSLRHSRRDAS